MSHGHCQQTEPAWARFQALLSHPLSSGDEGEVSQFHEIVSALEEAFNVDLSSFRIQKLN